jgi:hypothetical protein
VTNWLTSQFVTKFEMTRVSVVCEKSEKVLEKYKIHKERADFSQEGASRFAMVVFYLLSVS